MELTINQALALIHEKVTQEGGASPIKNLVIRQCGQIRGNVDKLGIGSVVIFSPPNPTLHNNAPKAGLIEPPPLSGKTLPEPNLPTEEEKSASSTTGRRRN